MFLYVSIFRVKSMTESIIKNVRIVSYNCNSIRSEIDVIREILTRCDSYTFMSRNNLTRRGDIFCLRNRS